MAKDHFYGIIGRSSCMQELFKLIAKLAEDDLSTVLIQGESGTGKELVAKAIHKHSPRKDNNFVPVNCAAIPEDLLESELFGHEKGSFTGAHEARKGYFEVADGGTIFLDEIGELPLQAQARLLRVLQNKEIERIGGVETIRLDIRIIAATNRNLEKMVQNGEFREDLFYRISEIPLEIPPLRDREGDIIVLARFFFEKFNEDHGRKLRGFTKDALSAMESYSWPGNVRDRDDCSKYNPLF